MGGKAWPADTSGRLALTVLNWRIRAIVRPASRQDALTTTLPVMCGWIEQK
jgi:hypothetical protein